ncbi:MAG: DUF86 domain-containing protein [Bacteroidetes bacterium]|nr:DUF86 domain-containing protein [Bacteroidota bacterium]
MQGITTYEQYAASITVKDAVERRLIIIGEAVNKLMLLDPDDPIEDGQKIRAFRNRLVHSYDATDDMTVWAILRNHLGPLRKLAEERSR